jgi:WD40 repeat protein
MSGLTPLSCMPRLSFCWYPARKKVFEYLSGTQESLSQTGYHHTKSLMKYSSLAILCGVALLLCLVAPAACAVTPLWIQPATLGGELSGVVISEDESTIVAGGDQLIVLSPDGKKRWTAWGSTRLDISRDGNYILTSDGRVVRLISGTGTLFWEQSMDMVVTDISLAPDASAIAASGGGQVRTMTMAGEPIASNVTMAINHIRITPSGKQIIVTSSSGVQVTNLTIISKRPDSGVAQDLVEVADDEASFVTATNGRVRMFNGSGGMLWEQKLPSGNALALAWSRDHSTIVIGTDDDYIRVLNNKGTLLWSANATNWITSVAVSGDGNTVVAGSLDKKVHAFNHVGSRLGIFSAKSPIDPHSVAVTRDGTLIIVVDQTAVYGLQRSAFIPQEMPGETIATPSPETTGETIEETTTTLPHATTTRKPTSRTMTIPTPYPTGSPTEEADLPPAVLLLALGFLIFCRSGKR